eukprot:TRINITY_DN2924_c0_g1_i1.p1 TRINITY_DN2924_c0_g1~~TRINITY_DN2924_c0_g1_i1.p1  ORF type:complete len:202 (-),score=41.85 TRINITY_DN2924_c0_g1_i1:95-700(-)
MRSFVVLCVLFGFAVSQTVYGTETKCFVTYPDPNVEPKEAPCPTGVGSSGSWISLPNAGNKKLTEQSRYDFVYSLVIPAAIRQKIISVPQINHANIHFCRVHMNCTPLDIDWTQSHTDALTGNFQGDKLDFTSKMLVNPGRWTTIAHWRFVLSDDVYANATWDLAIGTVLAVDPLPFIPVLDNGSVQTMLSIATVLFVALF